MPAIMDAPRKNVSAGKKKFIKIVEKFSRAKVLVLGDFILDQFIWGNVERISPEAPVPVVHVQNESYMLGGSLNVAHNIHVLGGVVYPCGVLGRDRDGRILRKTIYREGVDAAGIVYDEGRPTTVKTRVIAHSQQVVRFDREVAKGISTKARNELYSFISERMSMMDAVVVEDYGKGVIEPQFLKNVIKLAKQNGKPVLVDPKEKHFSYYKGATLITPNRKEALGGCDALRIPHQGDIHAAGDGLLKKLGCEGVLITLGEDGMALFEKQGKKTHVPTAAREVYDVSGAGDTVIAILSLAIAAGASMKDAAILANIAASIVVGKLGTATVSPEELIETVKAS